jgi:alkylation response protein AidB-like acyl-CoA dehydrogenase
VSAAQHVSAELAQVIELVDDLAGSAGDTISDDTPDGVAGARARLGGLGLWTAGVAGERGGGGDPAAAAVVVRRLAHRWAALAWGAVQAHAAAAVLAGSPRWAGLLARIHLGEAAVAVTDLAAPASRLQDNGGTITAAFGRVDGCAPQPWIVALEPPRRAWVLPPEATRFEPLRHTGLDGACTGRVTVPGPLPVAECVADGVDAAAALVLLRLGAAAAALGLAEAASDGALRYCTVRRQFGGPLTDLPTVREALYLTARDPGLIEVGSLSPASVAPAQAAALADAACEAAVRAAAGALQLHGGYGYLTEYGAERLLRDAVSLRAACDAARCRREGALALVAAHSRGLT